MRSSKHHTQGLALQSLFSRSIAHISQPLPSQPAAAPSAEGPNVLLSLSVQSFIQSLLLMLPWSTLTGWGAEGAGLEPLSHFSFILFFEIPEFANHSESPSLPPGRPFPCTDKKAESPSRGVTLQGLYRGMCPLPAASPSLWSFCLDWLIPRC